MKQQISGENAANEALEQILQTQWDGIPVVRIDSPPGAGKTGVAERLAIQCMALLNERVMITTQTNQQTYDLVLRLARGFPKYDITLYSKRRLEVSNEISNLPNTKIIHDLKLLPPGPCIVISNAAKWSWVSDDIQQFDLQIIDEAFQLPDYRFHQISNLSKRIVLIGDPGQIDPVITSQIERWRGNEAGPQAPAPKALSHRRPEILRLSLPISRRLIQDTVDFVQPAFYPDLTFKALSPEGPRRFKVDRSENSSRTLDQAIEKATQGESIVGVELPQTTPGFDDPELAGSIVQLIEKLIKRNARVVEDGETRSLKPENIGVVCAHVVQVHSVRERLPAHLAGILVETADRFQGLERDMMIVHHPLSGRADVSEFHLDAGRLCVMLSRHRIACFVFMRSGIESQLLDHGLSGDRILSIDEDREYNGWKSHLTMIQKLQDKNRIIQV